MRVTKRKKIVAMTILAACLGNAGCGEEPEDEPVVEPNAGDTDTETDSVPGSDTDTASEDDNTDDEGTVDDLNSLIGGAFVLQIDEGNWTTPVGVGGEVGGYVPDFAFEIKHVVGGELDVLIGTAIDNTQDRCNEAITFSGSIEENPFFQLGPADFHAIIEGEESKVIAMVHDLTISGTFIEQGAGFKNGTLATVVDFRDIYSLFTLLTDPTPDKICEAAPNMGFNCEICPFDGEPYCISLKAEALKASRFPSLVLDAISEIDENCLDL